MCGRNVLQIGMYLSVELWVEAIFYIHSYIILFICLFVASLLIFVGWRPQLFTSFVLFLFIIVQLKANSSCSNTQKAVSNLQMSRLQSLS